MGLRDPAACAPGILGAGVRTGAGRRLWPRRRSAGRAETCATRPPGSNTPASISSRAALKTVASAARCPRWPRWTTRASHEPWRKAGTISVPIDSPGETGLPGFAAKLLSRMTSLGGYVMIVPPADRGPASAGAPPVPRHGPRPKRGRALDKEARLYCPTSRVGGRAGGAPSVGSGTACRRAAPMPPFGGRGQRRESGFRPGGLRRHAGFHRRGLADENG